MATYSRNMEAEGLGKDLIAKHHQHLETAGIAYLFTDSEMKTGGQIGLAKARKLPDLTNHLTGFHIALLFQDNQWSGLSPAQRKALVDQELQRCAAKTDEEGVTTYSVGPLTWEDLVTIIQRHGLWHQPIKEFAQAVVKQLDLFEQSA